MQFRENKWYWNRQGIMKIKECKGQKEVAICHYVLSILSEGERDEIVPTGAMGKTSQQMHFKNSL